jgi:hypothetical protein
MYNYGDISMTEHHIYVRIFCICGLFNDIVSSSQNIWSRMIWGLISNALENYM